MSNTAANNSSNPGKRQPAYIRWLVAIAGLGLAGAASLTAGIIGAWYYVEPGLPAAETIREIPLQIPLRIYSRDGHLIEEVGERRRILVTYDDLPQHVVDAFVAAEDRRFFVHPGVDYQGILRAGVRMLTSGEISGGGSTLTQQLARDYFLTRERVFTRKLREAFLAYKIEQEFSKEEIMALFLNKMFFGQRAYGVAAASQAYFGKPLQDINEAEAATLAGVLPAPSRYNPVRSVPNASMRRAYVLGRMHDLDFIDDATYEEAMNYPVESRLYGTKTELLAPYVAEMVRREMLERYGESTYSAGFSVSTTLDSRMQKAANYSLRNGLLEFTRRRGYRGPIAQLEVEPEVLAIPLEEWPEELALEFGNYNSPGSLSTAIVTAVDEELNNASITLQNGETSLLEWFAISWAKPFIDPETTGPSPESVAEVLQPGDIVYVMPITLGGYALAQAPLAQSAVVSMDPDDGAITSLAGGYDFGLSKFNRVTQAIRQPGSSFKPFIYGAALNQGNTLATIVEDAPVVINSSELERVWRPINYSGRFYGYQRIREALVRSMNLASVRLLLYNTGIGNAIRFLSPFGFNDAALPRNGSLALGGGNATPLDMAQAYATFANGGYAVKPYVIDSIRGPDGEVLYNADPQLVCRACAIREPEVDEEMSFLPEVAAAIDVADESIGRSVTEADAPTAFDDFVNDEEVAIDPLVAELQALFPGLDDPALSMQQFAQLAESYRPDINDAPEMFDDVNAAPRIISEQIAYLIQDAMRSVIRRGTGVRAWRALQRRDLSGKTGTSNDGRDAWFAGYNSDLVSIVWVGYDDHTPLGPREEGSRTALPVWIEFMKVAMSGTPLNAMPMPEGITNVKINRTTGCPATSRDPYEDTMFEIFRDEYVPKCDDVGAGDEIFEDYDLNDTESEEEETEDDDTLF